MSTDTERDLSERLKEERITQAKFEQYAKEHNLFVCTANIFEQIKSKIEQIEAPKDYPYDMVTECVKDEVLQIINTSAPF